jgi:hypothetical protein
LPGGRGRRRGGEAVFNTLMLFVFEEYWLLECDMVLADRNSPTFLRNVGEFASDCRASHPRSRGGQFFRHRYENLKSVLFV